MLLGVTRRRCHLGVTTYDHWSMELPPNKRQRSDSTGDARIRSECWFQDGNIVLQAENTIFRVHQSILSRHSEIFEKIFSELQPEKLEHIEGCPVVHLPDTAEDVCNIITLLYDSNKLLNLHKDLTIDILRSMLRFGKKYAITHFENRALEALHHDFSTTLQDWDTLTIDSQQIKYSEEHTHLHLTQVISLGHEFNLLTILPAAYLSYLGFRILVFIAADDLLPEKARQRCLVGNSRILEHLKNKNLDAFFPPLIIPSQACSTRRNCEANKWQSIKDLPIWRTAIDSTPTGLLHSSHPPKDTENMCAQCREAAVKLTNQVRSDFWSILPSFFDLPAWANLRDGG